MKPILLKLLGRASDLADVEPLLALFLGAALLAVFLSAFRKSRSNPDPSGKSSLLWTLYGHFTRLSMALMLVALLVAAISVLRIYLRQAVANFQRTHGRVTQANYNAVQTIWGAEQEQGELKVEIYTDEEVTERIESEDLTKPAVLRKKIVRHPVTANPFVTARHEVVLKQNPRKKGSAYYGGYETVCRFSWKLNNPAGTPQKCNLVFPLPAAGAQEPRRVLLVFSGEGGAGDSRFPADVDAAGLAERQTQLSRRLHDTDGHSNNHQRPGFLADFPPRPRHLQSRNGRRAAGVAAAG